MYIVVSPSSYSSRNTTIEKTISTNVKRSVLSLHNKKAQEVQ
jgi:hypothetical protein